MKTYRMLAAIGAVTLLAACGSDDDDASETTESAQTTQAPVTTAASTTVAVDATQAGVDTTAAAGGDLCALATEMFGDDALPTAAQMTKYKELAPAEIKEDVDFIVGVFVPIADDPVAFYNAFGDDEVKSHVDAVDAWEEANCGIPHSEENTPLPAGATREVEDDANRVDVTALDYEFQLDAPTEAGRTSFVLTNSGKEAHFLAVFKLAEGVTLEQALNSDDGEGMVLGVWETDVAAAGGEDEEAITFDLEPGNYGLACFIPNADGTPHAFLGMTAEFTVAAG